MELKLKATAMDRITAFSVIFNDMKLGLITADEAKEYINIINNEDIAELELLGVNFHSTRLTNTPTPVSQLLAVTEGGIN